MLDVERYVKVGKDFTIEIDEVEYLFDDTALQAVRNNDTLIPLVELFDRQTYLFNQKKIEEAIAEEGIIDYLDKRKK